MKPYQTITKFTWAYLVPVTLVASLVACGDDISLSNITGAGSNNYDEYDMRVITVPSGATTGVLMDAPVSGVSYLASSGKSGVTDKDGIFDYDHGDMVEFKLGDLLLGKVSGSPIITPFELAGGNKNKLQNLLVLLQSLDSDGDLSNGISITTETAATIKKSINLSGDPEKFASSAKLQEILATSSTEGSVKTTEEADAHFLFQSTTMLGGNVWVKYNDHVANLMRFAADGSREYVYGQASPDDSCNTNRVCAGKILYRAGVEYGIASALTYNTRGFLLTGETTVDTNLRAGLSDTKSKTRIRSDGYTLILSDIVNVQMEREQPGVFSEIFHIGGASSTVRARSDIAPETEVVERQYKRVENDPFGIIGAWAYAKDTINTRTIVFLPEGRFFAVDPTGEVQREDQAKCAKPGVEYAVYAYNKSANQLKISGFTYNTDGCIGFSGLESDVARKFTISADGDTATLEQQGDEPVTLYRISG